MNMNGFTTMMQSQSAPNETLVEVASKYDRCDYQLLFSHLSVSFRHLAQFQFEQVLSFFGTHTSSILNPSMTTTTTTSTSSTTQANMVSQYEQQSVQKLCYAIVALIIGLFYSLIGYRFLKLSTFLIGFSLGSSIIYLILAEQKQLTLIENLIISLSIGCLFAFVALLVQYIGLFLLGITSSISIVTCTLIVIDLFHTNNSAWLCILLLFTCATIVASITLKFQKSLTIFNTSAIGAGLLLIAVDYFVENNLLIDYIYELYKVNGNSFNIYERQRALLKSSADLTGGGNELHMTTTTSTTPGIVRMLTTTGVKNRAQFNGSMKVNATVNAGQDVTTTGGGNSALALFLHLYSSAHARLCWYTWLIFGTYFIMLVLSILIQYLVTGKNYDHRDSWQKLIRGSRKKRSANLEKIRLKSHMNESSGHSSSGAAGGSGSRHHHQSEHSRDRDRDRDRDRERERERDRHHHHKAHHHQHHQKAHQSSNHPNYSSNDHSSILSSSSDDISLSSQNDTLLLVESGRANGPCDKKTSPAYHVSSSNEHNNNQKRRRKPNEAETQIVTSPPRRDVKRTKTKQHSSSAGPKTTAVAKVQIQSSSISTTTSTSSASSTCHLIPPKSTAETTTTSSVSPKLPEPSAPPITLASATSTISSQQQPPPVPALPPPKLPPLFANTNSTAGSTSTTIQQMTSLQNNLAKLKHRNNSTKDRDKDSSEDKFRHFYQIRRNNGDVLSQDFLNNFQSKLASSSNLTNSSSGTAATNAAGTSSLTSNDPKKKSRSSSSSSKSKS